MPKSKELHLFELRTIPGPNGDKLQIQELDVVTELPIGHAIEVDWALMRQPGIQIVVDTERHIHGVVLRDELDKAASGVIDMAAVRHRRQPAA